MKNRHPLRKLTLLLVSSLTIMSIVTISPALPRMSEVFSEVPGSALLVKMVLTLPALFIGLSGPFVGRVIDRYGRLKLLYAALLLYAGAGAAGYLLNDLYAILFSRALLGVAVGMTMTIAITLIGDYFEGPERRKFIGLQVAFMSGGGILFLGLGGWLTDVGWRYPFLIYLFALLVLPLTRLFLNEPNIGRHSGPKAKGPVRSPSIIWLLFGNTMLMWIIFFLIPVQAPFHLQAIGIAPNALIGFAIAVATATSALSSSFYSRLKGWLSYHLIFATGYSLMALGFFLLAIAQNYPTVLFAMLFSGLGIGMMIPNTNMWIMQIAPPSIRGREVGRLTTFWYVGQFLSPLAVMPLLRVLSLAQTFLLGAALLFLLALTFVLFYRLDVGSERKEAIYVAERQK